VNRLKLQAVARLLRAATLALAIGGCANPFSPSVARVRPIPPIEECWIDDAPVAIENLKLAYQKRDLEKMSALLHPDFRFILDTPAPDGASSWDAAEEKRIHRRMFQPARLTSNDPPLPEELWLVSVDIVLIGATSWEDLPGSGGELVHAFYNATVYFETAGQVDFRVESRQEFVVKIDRSQAYCTGRRFLLYRWIDLGTPGQPAAPEQRSWSAVKQLYRGRAGSAEANGRVQMRLGVPLEFRQDFGR